MTGEPIDAMSVRLRPAEPADAWAIAGIHVRTWKLAYKGLLPDEALSSLAVADRFRHWQRLLNDERAPVAVHIAEIGSEIVGFCSVGPPQDPADRNPDVSELFAIDVEPQYQARGVGARLLAAAERTMREWGALTGVLWVLIDNEPAKSFYAWHDWSADGALKTATVLGIEVHEARFRKNLVGEPS